MVWFFCGEAEKKPHHTNYEAAPQAYSYGLKPNPCLGQASRLRSQQLDGLSQQSSLPGGAVICKVHAH
jgi:hypothetical protein